MLHRALKCFISSMDKCLAKWCLTVCLNSKLLPLAVHTRFGTSATNESCTCSFYTLARSKSCTAFACGREFCGVQGGAFLPPSWCDFHQ